jgi:hypothetical protein
LQADTLNGISIDNNTKQFIYENSQPIYKSQLTGEPIDALQAVVEELKFGENANPSFYAELLLFATNPDLYKQSLQRDITKNAAIKKERELRKTVSQSISGTNYGFPSNNRNTREIQKW